MMSDKEQSDTTTTYIKNLFTQNLPSILLVPIHNNDHWSLLYYRTSTGVWHHMDSLAPYHTSYVEEVMEELDALGYLLSPNNEVVHFRRMPRQPQGWECGIYLLLYMLIVSESRNDKEIQEKIVFTSESHRKELTQSLLSLLRCT
jgi:Ulp1 family protease